ncbi:MAG: phenylalanine--tRNA ligase subunit beta [Candidatus Hodarchaeota archaeon]
MPTLNFSYNDLCQLIGKKIEKKRLEELILLNKGEVEDWKGDEMTVEVTSDRIDLLSVEGIARALKGFLEIELGIPKYPVQESNVRLTVDEEVNQVRPFVVSGIIEDVELTDTSVAQLMQMQEKLHATHCRNRRKASIGLHDLDKIKPPIIYTAKRPDEIYFIPLQETKAMDGKEILRKVKKGVAYASLIRDSPLYPVIIDSEETFLSLPPIINSVDTAVDPDTKNLFFEITCLDEQVARTALNVLLCNICERKGTIKTVEIEYYDGRIVNLPDLTPQNWILHLDYTNQILGLNLNLNELNKLIKKSRMESNQKDRNTVEVFVPPFRSNILHEIDLIEDVSIAYGYNKYVTKLPKVITIGKEDKKAIFTRKIRELMVGFGFQEISNYIMTNKEHLFSNMNLDEIEIVEIANPVSTTFSVLRNNLIPSMLNFLQNNLHAMYPQKIFEAGDVVIVDKKAQTKTKTMRKLCAAITAYSISFENIQAVLFSLLQNLGLKNLELTPKEHNSFIQGRVAEIHVNGENIGIIGEISIPVLKNFALENPVALFEIELDQLLK